MLLPVKILSGMTPELVQLVALAAVIFLGGAPAALFFLALGPAGFLASAAFLLHSTAFVRFLLLFKFPLFGFELSKPQRCLLLRDLAPKLGRSILRARASRQRRTAVGAVRA